MLGAVEGLRRLGGLAEPALGLAVAAGGVVHRAQAVEGGVVVGGMGAQLPLKEGDGLLQLLLRLPEPAHLPQQQAQVAQGDGQLVPALGQGVQDLRRPGLEPGGLEEEVLVQIDHAQPVEAGGVEHVPGAHGPPVEGLPWLLGFVGALALAGA